ncbi:hypothetical protein ABET23_07835 [Bacillus wiedmannii]
MLDNVGAIGDMYNQFEMIMREIGVQWISSREIMVDAFSDLESGISI